MSVTVFYARIRTVIKPHGYYLARKVRDLNENHSSILGLLIAELEQQPSAVFLSGYLIIIYIEGICLSSLKREKASHGLDGIDYHILKKVQIFFRAERFSIFLQSRSRRKNAK